MKTIYTAALALIISGMAMGQTAVDALNLSSTQYGSTARSAAMGGAFGALGADFSAISINPAGLGVYRGGEFSFSPNLTLNKSTSEYLSLSSDDKRLGMNFENLGLVFTTPTLKDKGIVSVNFGIGYNRIKNFNRNVFIQGNGSEVSQLNFYAEDLAAFGENDALWDSYLAYESWLVDKYPNDDGNLVYEPILLKDVLVDQTKSISEKGRIDEWQFSMAFNINHKVYVGASLGVRDVYYNKETRYGEAFGLTDFGSYSQWDEVTQSYVNYDNGGFQSKNYLTTSGYGFNGKLGVIFRPIDNLRLGVAVHTPTYYVLEDNFSYTMDANVFYPEGSLDLQPDIQNSPDLVYDYNIYSSPLNLEFSMAYVLGKYGVFSLDYGLSDYSGMTINERGNTTGEFTGVNQLISDVYGMGSSLRTGIELKASPNFSLRGGFASYGIELTDNANAYSFDKPGAINQYSLGFGYRDNSFFWDFAYVLQTQNLEHSLFVLDNTEPTASIDYRTNKIMMTIGFRF